MNFLLKDFSSRRPSEDYETLTLRTARKATHGFCRRCGAPPPSLKKTTLLGRSVFKSFINNESGCGLHRAMSVRHADCSIEDTCRGSIVRRVSVFSYHRRRVPAPPRLSFSLRFLSATFYPVNSLPAPSCGSFLLLLCRRPCCLEFARKAERVSRGKPNDVMQDRFFFFYSLSFLKRPDDALMRPGLCGWTETPDFARDRRG